MGVVGIYIGACAALLLAAGSEPPRTPAAAVDDDPDGPRFRIGLLAASSVDETALRDALALRMPDLEFQTSWTDKSADAVFISVHPTDDGTAVRTELIADGRGYVRQLDVPPHDVRGIASVLANLLFSIEHEAVEADVHDVEAPRTSEPAEVERAVATFEDTKPLESPAAPEPEAEAEAATLDPPAPSAVPKTPPPPAPAPTWMGSVQAAGGILLPIGGPRVGSILQAGGFELGGDAEHRRGARFGLRVRYLAGEAAGFRLSRVRIAAAAGYAWRIGPIDVPVRAELGVEPWWVVVDGERLSASDLDAPAGGTVALGGAIRFDPAFVIPVEASALRELRIGPTLALSGSFVLDGGPRVATVVSGDPPSLDDPLFRVGGAELSAGLQLTLAFGRAPSKP